ncbi:MAG: hypothetical protein A2X18_00110 [Bacteroidetes bacterium GWF2_40_14]|nr:MAG: hypothetical protein A2X18_00110 [Bacteroidetes bacterium GWF2_40_14]
MKRQLLLAFALSLYIYPAFAQDSRDYDRFVREAGEFSNIYRGQAPLDYNFFHTGTFYAYSSEFEKGDVLFNGKLYKDIYMNLNSHLDELNVLIKTSGRIVVLNGEFVDFFNLGKRKFINIKKDDQFLQKGYYEVLYYGVTKLYKKTKKLYSERINESIGAKTQSKLERLFVLSESYYLVKENSVKLIKNKSDLLAGFRDRKRDIRQFIRERNLDMKHDKDHSFAMIIGFVESSTIKSDE